jgi:hypothetical protein
MNPHFTSLSDAVAPLRTLQQAASLRTMGAWSLFQIVTHWTYSIEYSMTRYPVMRPIWFRRAIGPIAAALFIRNQAMRHGLDEQIPGAPDVPVDGDLTQAFERLYAAIDKFLAYEGTLAEHFAYGRLTKQQYSVLQALHIKNHWSEIQIVS